MRLTNSGAALIYDQVKFSSATFADERASLALVVDEAEDHGRRMHVTALGTRSPTRDAQD